MYFAYSFRPLPGIFVFNEMLNKTFGIEVEMNFRPLPGIFVFNRK